MTFIMGNSSEGSQDIRVYDWGQLGWLQYSLNNERKFEKVVLYCDGSRYYLITRDLVCFLSCRSVSILRAHPEGKLASKIEN